MSYEAIKFYETLKIAVIFPGVQLQLTKPQMSKSTHGRYHCSKYSRQLAFALLGLVPGVPYLEFV